MASASKGTGFSRPRGMGMYWLVSTSGGGSGGSGSSARQGERSAKRSTAAAAVT
jgi:hypothetical protein